MRNNGWYIPYWRKSRKKGKPERVSTEEVLRNDDQLEAVRQRWVERYRRTAHALVVLGLSIGSDRAEVQARYDRLRDGGRSVSREVEDAYRYLWRVLPGQERRKRKATADDEAAPGAIGTDQLDGQRPSTHDITTDTVAVEAAEFAAGDASESEAEPYDADAGTDGLAESPRIIDASARFESA